MREDLGKIADNVVEDYFAHLDRSDKPFDSVLDRELMVEERPGGFAGSYCCCVSVLAGMAILAGIGGYLLFR